jgi:hypothetical protein
VEGVDVAIARMDGVTCSNLQIQHQKIHSIHELILEKQNQH